MQRKEIFSIFCICLFFCLIFTGCSYHDVDNKLQAIINKDNNGTIERESVEPVTHSFGNTDILKIGDTLPDFWTDLYHDVRGNEKEAMTGGINGLTWTFNSIEVFSSFYDADIEISETEWDTFELADKILKDNAFVLIDITAAYKAPANNKKEIIASAGSLSAVYDETRLSRSFDDIKGSSYKHAPYFIYFSKHPTADDKNLDPSHQYDCFYIKDGEEFNFKLGLIAASEFIDSKNIFIGVGNMSYVDPETGETPNLNGRILNLFEKR